MPRLTKVVLCAFIITSLLSQFSNSAIAYYNQMPASVVIGQLNFTSGTANQGGGVNANTISGPVGVYYDNSSGKLFVADAGNNRVLVYNSLPTSNDTSADLVIGQPDFTSNLANQGGSPGANTLSNPGNILIVNGRLLISDGSNHRILIYNSIPTSNNASADVVIGQQNLSSGTINQGGTPSARTVGANGAIGMASDGKKLFVADSANNRVLIFNSIPTTNNAAADLVLGQNDFTTKDGGTSATTFSTPIGILYAEGKLLVGDVQNNRVLIWNSIPTQNQTPADVVIGKPNFTSTVVPDPPYMSRRPTALAYDGKRLFVSNDFRNMVAVYNGIPTQSFTPYNYTLGQHNMANPIDSSRMWGPWGIAVAENKVIIASRDGHNRVLIFDNVVSSPKLTVTSLHDSPERKQKISGNVVLGERGKYNISNIQASVNGQGFGNVTHRNGGRDFGDGETIYEFYHEFEPWQGLTSKDQYDPGKGYTLLLKALTSNAEANYQFLLWPFTLKAINGSVNQSLVIGITHDQWQRVKDNIQSLVVSYSSTNGISWTELETLPLTDDIYNGSSNEIILNPISQIPSGDHLVKVIAKDKWGHSQESNIQTIKSEGIASYAPVLPKPPYWFPLQINKITGSNAELLNSYQSPLKNSFTLSNTKPTIRGLAYAGAEVNVLVTDPVTSASNTYKTIVKPDSTWEIMPTINKTSIVDVWVVKNGIYNQLSTFKLAVGEN